MTSTVAAQQDIGIHPAERLPAGTHLGRVRLAVSSLEQSIHFYGQVIGLAVLKQSERMAQLGPHGSSQVLLELVETPGVQPIANGKRLGLYHTAFLLPSRKALRSFVRNLNKLGVPFGAGDHIYSEAIYLTDPDGLEVEVYADRDHSSWRVEGHELLSATNAVRINELVALADDHWTGAPLGTKIGHVHMFVGELDKAKAFYHSALGMDIMTWRFPGALFVSADGYHHHIGLNVWAAGSPPASETDARLLFWELAFTNRDEILHTAERMQKAGYFQGKTPHGAPSFTDPWGIQVALVLA